MESLKSYNWIQIICIKTSYWKLIVYKKLLETIQLLEIHTVYKLLYKIRILETI